MKKILYAKIVEKIQTQSFLIVRIAVIISVKNVLMSARDVEPIYVIAVITIIKKIALK